MATNTSKVIINNEEIDGLMNMAEKKTTAGVGVNGNSSVGANTTTECKPTENGTASNCAPRNSLLCCGPSNTSDNGVLNTIQAPVKAVVQTIAKPIVQAVTKPATTVSTTTTVKPVTSTAPTAKSTAVPTTAVKTTTTAKATTAAPTKTTATKTTTGAKTTTATGTAAPVKKLSDTTNGFTTVGFRLVGNDPNAPCAPQSGGGYRLMPGEGERRNPTANQDTVRLVPTASNAGTQSEYIIKNDQFSRIGNVDKNAVIIPMKKKEIRLKMEALKSQAPLGNGRIVIVKVKKVFSFVFFSLI